MCVGVKVQADVEADTISRMATMAQLGEADAFERRRWLRRAIGRVLREAVARAAEQGVEWVLQAITRRPED